MRRRILLKAGFVALASLLNACEDAAHPAELISVSRAVGRGEERRVIMRDACDPESFGAVGVTCVREGGLTLDRFLDLLRKHQTVEPWGFSPGRLSVHVGQTLLASNQGGEVHTFTEVAAFGGGVNDLLNNLSGHPTPAPECQNLPPNAFIAPGASQIEEVGAPGTKHYQCCIHPWMRVDLQALGEGGRPQR
jgi:hypothetical protein